jgi:AAA15 family ATPase/GTPase
MLLRFRVANVRSLRDEQELSFVAPEDDGSERVTARETQLSDGRRLPVHTLLGVFGANASGKSNLIAALRDMRR